MSDISDKHRKFIVHFDGCRHARHAGHYELVEIEPGEDADAVCADVLDTMIGNYADSGWGETNEEEIAVFRKRGKL